MSKKIFDKTMIKFVIVGVINTLVGNGVMFALYNLCGVSYNISTIANYVVGSIVSYFLNKYYTFNRKEKSVKEVFRFILNIVVCYIVAYGVAKPLIYAIFSGFAEKIKDNIAMLVGSGIFIVLNYFGQRFFAFREDK
jgi:putative flippase GtrA